MIRRPPRSTLFPTRRSSDLVRAVGRDVRAGAVATARVREHVVDRQPGMVRGQHDEAAARPVAHDRERGRAKLAGDRKSTRLNSSHSSISYAVFCLKKNKLTI